MDSAAAPLAIDDMQAVLADALRLMLAARAASAVERLETDARNVQRYGLGPLALTSVMVPVGGFLYAYVGLPPLTVAGLNPDYDPVVWLSDQKTIPDSRASAQSLLGAIDDKFS